MARSALCGTRRPLPFVSSSAGPESQRVATQAAPHDIASSNTFGKPSYREGSAKIADAPRAVAGLAMRPGNATRSFSASSEMSDSRRTRSGPSPNIVSRHSGKSSATMANARSSRSNPFCGTSRPIAVISRARRFAGASDAETARNGFGMTATRSWETTSMAHWRTACVWMTSSAADG